MQKCIFLSIVVLSCVLFVAGQYRRTNASLTRVYLDVGFRAAEVVAKRRWIYNSMGEHENWEERRGYNNSRKISSPVSVTKELRSGNTERETTEEQYDLSQTGKCAQLSWNIYAN